MDPLTTLSLYLEPDYAVNRVTERVRGLPRNAIQGQNESRSERCEILPGRWGWWGSVTLLVLLVLPVLAVLLLPLLRAGQAQLRA